MGTDRSVAEIVGTISDGTSVLVVGALGSGRSFLIDAVTRALTSMGRPPLTVRAAAALSSTAFEVLRTNTAVSQLLDPAPARPTDLPLPVLVIDDGHLLDVDSARWLAQAVHSKRVIALVVGAPSSSAEARRARTETLLELDELWISGQATRIDLRPLSFADAEELIEAEAGHGVVDRIRRADLYRASGGSRLFLIEMVRSLADDASAASSGIRITNRIRDVLRYQLSTLSRDQRLCLALVNRLGGIARPRLIRVIEARAVDRLREKGHLVADDRRPDMLRASTILTTLNDFFEETDAVDDLVDTIGDILPPETMLSADESTDLAMRWSFDCRLERAIDRHGAETVRRITLTASTAAAERGRFRDALLLAEMAESTGASVDTRLAASRALSGLRRDEESLHTLESAVPLLTEDAEALRLYQWWSALLMGLARYDDLPVLSEAASDWPVAGGLLRGEIRETRVQAACAFMQWDDVARWGWEILHDTSCALLTRVRSGVEAASALAYRGDVEAAFRCLDIARRINTDPRSNGVIDDVAQTTVLTGEAILRVTLGMCVRDVLAEVESILTRNGPRPDGTVLAFLAYTGAVADLFRGDLRATDLEYRSAVERFTSTDSTGWRSGIHCEHALVLSLLGDSDSAGRALRQAEDLAATRSPLTRHLYLRARFVIAVQAGSPEADAVKAELLALSIDSPTLRAIDLYLALVLDRGSADERLELQHIVDDDRGYVLARLFNNHLVAREGGEGRQLELAATSFADAGVYLFAVRAQKDAVTALELDGNSLRVAQAKRQLAAYGVLSRRTDSAESDPSTDRLSEREPQVATLVAEGLSNRQIADRLFLSVRTVESHIYQARLKLGAPTRRGLADVLDSVG